MTLFPQLADSYYVDNDHNILKRMDNDYGKYITINQSYWAEADNDNRFAAGDQTLTNDIFGNLPAFRKRQFTFNRTRRVVNMITGYQRQHRKSTMCEPVHPEAQANSDQYTKLLYHVNNQARILETLSESFEGAVIGGMNLLALYLDYTRDPINGDIKIDNIGYAGYLIDPYFRKMDLSDCQSIWTRKYISRHQAASLLPGREDEIKGLAGWGNRDGKFQYLPESYAYGQQDLLIYDEFWYLTTRKQKLIVDTETGESIEWKGEDDDLEYFLGMYPESTTINQEVPTVSLAIVVQGKVFYHGPNPLGVDNYPFVPVWAYYHPEIAYYPWRIQGVVRGIRDAQYLYNRRRIIELDMLESQITSGFKYKENALVNPKDVFLQGQGRGLALKAEAQMTDVEQILPPQIPPSMIQLSELLGQEISQISGVNEELLGASQDDKAGILSLLRQGAGLTTLQVLFDQLDQSQKMLGNLCIDIIQANWTPGKVGRIIGEEPAKEFYNRAFLKYDAIVEEAPLTSTQKQLALQQALYLREIGVPIPTSYLIKNMNIPDKNELIEQIEAQEKQEQDQQQLMNQIQMQQMQVDSETKLSYSEAQHALASERMNKTKLDAALSAERMQRADEDRTGALLNLIKAAQEIKNLDLDHLTKALQIEQAMINPEVSAQMSQAKAAINPVQTNRPAA